MPNAPIRDQIINKDGIMPNVWVSFFAIVADYVSGRKPFPLKSYTVATAPDATILEGCLIYVSNETGGKTVAFSDGTNWRRVQDRVIIS